MTFSDYLQYAIDTRIAFIPVFVLIWLGMAWSYRMDDGVVNETVELAALIVIGLLIAAFSVYAIFVLADGHERPF